MTDAERVANQKASIQALYAEVDALRAKLATVREVLKRERDKREKIARENDDDAKADVMRMPC